MSSLPTTELEFDQNLNRLDSLLQGLGVQEKTRAGDIVGGVFGATNHTNGIEFGVDKSGGETFIQSRNFATGSAGWQIKNDGTAEFVSITASGYIAVGGAAADVNTGVTTISGNKLTTGTVTADYVVASISITSPTITGGTFQTSVSGQRVVIVDDSIKFYDQGGNFIATALADSNNLWLLTQVSRGINIYSKEVLFLRSDAYIDITASVYPAVTNTYNLGTSSYNWNYVYANRYYIGSTRKDDVWDAKPSLGETSTTAYRGDRGKSAYDHSVLTTTPHVTSTEKTTWNGKPNLGETSSTAYRGDYGKAAYDLRHARSHDHSSSSDGSTVQPVYCWVYGSTLDGSRLYVNGRTLLSERIRLWNNNGFPSSDLAEGQMYYHSGEDDVRVRRDTSWADLCWYDERNAASPLPTAENAIEKLKEIKGPTVSEDGLSFNTEDFPKEFHMTTSNKTLHTNLLPVIGLLIKSQKEILAKVEQLENKSI